MRATILNAIAAMADFGFQQAAAAESKTVLTVLLLQENVAPSLVIMPARLQAEKKLVDIAISIQWRSSLPHASLLRNYVIVDMGDEAPRSCYPGALAYGFWCKRAAIGMMTECNRSGRSFVQASVFRRKSSSSSVSWYVPVQTRTCGRDQALGAFGSLAWASIRRTEADRFPGRGYERKDSRSV
jgi:hypothetical protein